MALIQKEDSLISFALKGITKGFDLKFKHFLPLGLMHQLIVKFGQNPEKKYYYRYDMLFTYENEKVYLSVDVINLIISVRFNSDNTTIWNAIFTEILLTYNNLDDEVNRRLDVKGIEHQQKEKETNKGVKEKGTAKENFSFKQNRVSIINEIEIDYPEDLLISIHTEEKYFVAYSKLQEAQKEKFTTVTASNLKDKENHKEKSIALYKYNAFMKEKTKVPKSVFISYAHADNEYLIELQKYLTNLKREGLITWDDGKIEVGTDWDKEIKEQLDKAEIVIMLVSQSLIASHYVHEVELRKTLQKVRNGKKLIPILIKTCDFKNWKAFPYDKDETNKKDVTYISKYQFLPQKDKNLTPINKWEHPEEAWVQVIDKLREIIKK